MAALNLRLIWFCVLFGCLFLLVHCRKTTIPSGKEVHVAGSVPGPVSIFKTVTQCQTAVASNGQSCSLKILARPLEFEFIETASDSMKALTHMQLCSSVEMVASSAAGCAGRVLADPQRLCALLMPRKVETELTSAYCSCQDRVNFDVAYDILTYLPQRFACVREEDFVSTASVTEGGPDFDTRVARTAPRVELVASKEEEEDDEPEPFEIGSTDDEEEEEEDEEEEDQPEHELWEGRVLYGVQHGHRGSDPLNLFADIETCQRVASGRTMCLPYSVVNKIPTRSFIMEDYLDMAREEKRFELSPRSLLFPFAEDRFVSAYCGVQTGPLAYHLPVDSWSIALRTESQWFVCPGAERRPAVVSDSFSNVVRRAKLLPETVSLTVGLRTKMISLATFNHEQAQFMFKRIRRRGDSWGFPVKRGTVKRGKPYFIERVTLQVDKPKFHLWGDIHGSIHSLLRTLQQIGVRDDWTLENSSDVLVFLGDYVDRGDYGPEVLFVLMKLFNSNSEKVIIVRGNHETESMVEKYGFGDQLANRFGLDADDREEVYKLFEQLPAAVYVRDPNYDPKSGPHVQFYMFAHGGIQLSFDPSEFLSTAPFAPIVRATFTDWDPSIGFATNVIRWAQIKDEAVLFQERIGSESDSPILDFMVSNRATDGRSTVERNRDFLTNALYGKSSVLSWFESNEHPGYMWNDMTTEEHPTDTQLRVGLAVASNRGYIIPKTLVETYMRSNSIRTIFRAHQHNNAVDEFLTNLQQDYGLFAVYPKMDHTVTTRPDYHSRGWFTDVVPLDLSSAYTLNSSPNSGLGHHFDSYVILDFDTSVGHSDPMLSHRFCHLPDPIGGVRPATGECWYQPDEVRAEMDATDMLYGVQHGTSAISLFVSLSECQFAAKKGARCLPFLPTVAIDATTVSDLEAPVVGSIKHGDLIISVVNTEIAGSVCGSRVDSSRFSAWFFPQITARIVRQWFVCLQPGLVSPESFSALTARVKSVEETTSPELKSSIVSSDEFRSQYEPFILNRKLRKNRFAVVDSPLSSHSGSRFHVERIEPATRDAKIHIIGSLDGSIHSLIRILNEVGVDDDWKLRNRNDYVVFLGNYFLGSGYGAESLFVIMSLFNMNRHNVILVRGREETEGDDLLKDFATEVSSKFEWDEDDVDAVSELFELIPVAVYMKAPTTADAEHPQFVLFTSSGIQLSWDPSPLLTFMPTRKLVHIDLYDRSPEVFASNVIRWGRIKKKTNMKIRDEDELRRVSIRPLSEGEEKLRKVLDVYHKTLAGRVFTDPYAQLESSRMCGFVYNTFFVNPKVKSSASRTDVLMASTGGMLISMNVLQNYMLENSIRSVFKIYDRYDSLSADARDSLKEGYGLAAPSGMDDFEVTAAEEAFNGWKAESIPATWSPVWTLTSASESGLGFHFDSFVTLDWQTGDFTRHHCVLSEPTGESGMTRPAAETCWPGA